MQGPASCAWSLRYVRVDLKSQKNSLPSPSPDATNLPSGENVMPQARARVQVALERALALLLDAFSRGVRYYRLSMDWPHQNCCVGCFLTMGTECMCGSLICRKVWGRVCYTPRQRSFCRPPSK